MAISHRAAAEEARHSLRGMPARPSRDAQWWACDKDNTPEPCYHSGISFAVISRECSTHRGQLVQFNARLLTTKGHIMPETTDFASRAASAAKETSQQTLGAARRQTRQLAESTQRYIRENPLGAVSYASAAVFGLGILVGRALAVLPENS
jgi:ElaB/YqjD/DUF883 family membrane-anchored ribosome-binding protein